LNPLNAENTCHYIHFRLQKAGRTDNVFTPAAMNEIYNYSEGVPRKINNICDLALLVGFSMRLGALDAETVKKVIQDSL
jgi:type II secretory pathway predicted ATPase ExeA